MSNGNMLQLIMPEPILNASSSLISAGKKYQDESSIYTISPLSLSSPLSLQSSLESESVLSSEGESYEDIDALVTLMESLPEEIRHQIWNNLLSHPSKSLKLSTMLTCKKAYKQIVPTIYRKVVLNSSNCNAFFYGLGKSFIGSSAPASDEGRRWPVSGPGNWPLSQIGLSYDPSSRNTSFIRKFTLCNLTQELIISDPESLLALLKASSEGYRYNMDTWIYRVLFDQIDSITFKPTIFKKLDESVLVWKNLLLEVWNCIKSDCVKLEFPSFPSSDDHDGGSVLKEDTYRIAIKNLGSPQSLGQQGRLLSEVIIHTPQLDGIDLNEIGSLKVKIVLIDDVDGNNGIGGWIGCGEKIHLGCLSQEAQLRRFIRRHWLVGIDNTEYIGIPPHVERVEIHNVANYNRRRCITGRISSGETHHLDPSVGEVSSGCSLPTVLYSALEGDEELAFDVDKKIHLLGREA